MREASAPRASAIVGPVHLACGDQAPPAASGCRPNRRRSPTRRRRRACQEAGARRFRLGAM